MCVTPEFNNWIVFTPSNFPSKKKHISYSSLKMWPINKTLIYGSQLVCQLYVEIQITN